MDALINKGAAPDAAGASPVVRPSRNQAEEAVRTLIAWIGDDPSRAALVDTPRRIIDAYGELYVGYGESPADILDRTVDDVGAYDDLVVVRDIPVVSHCEHHMMAFTGRAHVAYYPAERVAGLSKLARAVDAISRRLQSQERLTSQVLDTIDEVLKPRGTAVMVEAEHTCMTLRGARAHGASTVTTQFSGIFRDDPQEQARFAGLVGTFRRA